MAYILSQNAIVPLLEALGISTEKVRGIGLTVHVDGKVDVQVQRLCEEEFEVTSADTKPVNGERWDEYVDRPVWKTENAVVLACRTLLADLARTLGIDPTANPVSSIRIEANVKDAVRAWIHQPVKVERFHAACERLARGVALGPMKE